jgi:hypothetical protein
MFALLPRRRFLIAGAAALATPATSRADAVGAPITFTVFRSGNPIGKHRVSFNRAGSGLAVEIAIDLQVRLLNIPVYRYTHRCTELWADGRLQSLDARTDDDGTRSEVRARATATGIAVEGSGGSFVAPADTKPTSYWHEDMTRRSRLLDTQNGQLIGVTATRAGTQRTRIGGQEIDVRFYELTGDLNSRLGYSASGEWVDLEFMARGSRISYLRDRPPASVTLSPAGFPRAG